MADLKTDYKDDILVSGQQRKYNLIENSDGTVSLVDVSSYAQYGDTLKAEDFNATNAAVNALNGKTVEAATDLEDLKESSTVLEAQVYLENFKSTDGSSFQKNFLNFGQLDFDKEAYFAKGDSESGWTNTPSIIGNTVWIGARRVYNHNNQHVLVEIIEFYPSPGRIWTNFYNVSYWSGWKSVTPQ